MVEQADVLRQRNDARSADVIALAENASRAGARPSDDVLAFVAHELRTPLAVIAGFAQTLADAGDRLDPVTRTICVDAILRNTRALDQLIDEFQSARAIETGRLRLARQTLDIAQLAHDVAGQARAAVTTVRHLIIDAEPAAVVADPERVSEALSHVVRNALSATPEGGVVEVVVRAAGANAIVSVADRGPGITGETARRLFERFARVPGTAGGVGLGLYIARGIARAHGGDLEFEPRAGGGARFLLRLPSAASASAG